ncbi:hypothetical protein GCM10007989_14940 [Devosia pacifica]|uniref:DUF2934 domain-containing protein n=1 Tax=Devosia pacifica TaxID=1335967 RepID=A0A918S501_9HYPH|nr:DUF2934 domain-containing protein [Devosia pacifica]GHA20811.1 hypothetical protein GCM10007989_14940 [Devosia pacifica]
MPDPNDPQDLAEFQHAVRDTAYFLWEQAGRPEGRPDEFWFQALEIHLRSRAYSHWLREQKVDPEPRAEERSKEPYGAIEDGALDDDEAMRMAESIEEERDA